MDEMSLSNTCDNVEPIWEFEGDIDPSTEIPHGRQILIISKDQSFLTHGIHKFPAKFFPELPRYLIRRYSNENDVVLDPMCGSGTVVLETLLNNRHAIGIDIDPIAKLVTKVKTTPIDEEVLRSLSELLTTRVLQRYRTKYSPNIPEFSYRDNWFRPFVLKELGIIRDTIHEISYPVSKELYDFHRTIFSSIIRDVSNADPHCTRTVIRKKQIRNISPGDTLMHFKQALVNQIDAMVEFTNLFIEKEMKQCEIPDTDAIETGIDENTINLIVTSPPYINAVDYPRTHQLEMYWLGLVQDGPLSKMKRKYIGTETVYKDEYEKLRQLGYSSLDPILSRIYAIDSRRAFITYKFFKEMKTQLKEMYRILQPGGYYCLAIGNNVIRGIRIRSHDILTEIATSEDVGFILERMFFSGLIRHFIKIPRRERMSGEWVLILKKLE